MQLRSHLGRVRGLGSSNQGIRLWWMQRLTGIALVPLTLWFVFSVVGMAGADHATVVAWVGRHYNPVLLIGLIVCMFHHGQLGLQVVIEDYVHAEAAKVTAIVLVKLGAVALAACTAFAVLRLTFGG
ncbi:MAG: succinate dehydrogenase, hydrophobic membrane anchor protein [Rhodospirillaceae bacterium]